jgi:hypothetical protein
LVKAWVAKGSKLERVDGVDTSEDDEEEDGEEEIWEVIVVAFGERWSELGECMGSPIAGATWR